MVSSSTKSLTLDMPVQYLKGIGPKRAELLKRVNVKIVEDLLNYFPRRYLDRSRLTPIRSLKIGEEVTVVGRILSREIKRGRRNRFIVVVGDNTGILHCVWFQGIAYVSKSIQLGETVAFSGKVTFYRGPQLVHPEYDKISEEGESDPLHTGRIIPMYPSTEFLSRVGLDSRGFRRLLFRVVSQIRDTVQETLSEEIRQHLNLMPISDAFSHIHFPENWQLFSQAQKRLKFEELFYIQLFLALERRDRELEQKGISFQRMERLPKEFLKKFSFELTDAQKRVVEDIRNDMKSECSMNRLLQGDVGSGKTVVAWIAILIAVENGYQAAFMAPTEILAEQHFLTTRDYFEELGVRVALLRGGQKSTERKEILEKLKKRELDVMIGTHALIQEGVEFQKLGVVVIDEQHRFGVMQRAILRQKGYSPDVLVMTATPIPRTLALTLYGDLDLSVLNEMPKGRRPVRTLWRREAKRDAMYDFVRSEMKRGRQVYVVYPLVEESEKVDLADATAGYETLSREIYPEFRVALLHGRMKAEEKDNIMKAFKSGEIQLLVCTTVVEVGVDVPNATIMIIEHSERFGLTQLHQLRGRIGRGTEQATCILLSQGFLSDDAMKRLNTMVETNDGFRIAEVDLEIRGPGELFGTRQHGILNLKIANLATDGLLLDQARKEAFRLVEQDPRLGEVRNRPIHETFQKRYREKFRLMKVG